MGKIFCIMGKSSSGKDTIYKELLNIFSVKENVMFTTRPKREGEVDGREYFFVNDKEFELMKKSNLVIESRTYDTIYGPWTYFTSSLGFNIDNNNYIVINTLEGYNSFKNKYSDLVVPIYINVDDGIRLERAVKREMLEENPKYEELCRRFLADQQDFSDLKLKEAGITKIYNNIDLKSTIEEISCDLEELGLKRINNSLVKRREV